MKRCDSLPHSMTIARDRNGMRLRAICVVFTGLLPGSQGSVTREEFGGADAAESVRVRCVRIGISVRRQSERSSRLRQRRVVQLSGCRLYRVAVHRRRLHSHPCRLTRSFATFTGTAD